MKFIDHLLCAKTLYIQSIAPQSRKLLRESKLLKMAHKTTYDLLYAFLIFFPLSVLPSHTLVPETGHHVYLSAVVLI